jgi:hypothetical protein
LDKYTFITPPDFTYEPDSDSPEPDVETMQAMGLVQGASPMDTLENLIEINQGHGNFKDVFGFDRKHRARQILFPKSPPRPCRQAS